VRQLVSEQLGEDAVLGDGLTIETGANLVLQAAADHHVESSAIFFLDLEGHIEEPPINAAVEDLRQHCQFLKILGSYPRVR
jgi:hypothetical protein